ncbi:MAG: hypothetical protein Q7S10_02015 [bacterium]|nr:hypothetical protein [bacterium]
MITGSNKERIEQEILSLIKFIINGRVFFFQKTGFSLQSSDDFQNHWESKELFQSYSELRQLELNIQLFYIKLSSYYKLVSREKVSSVAKPRNAFAHELNPIIFKGQVKYNFFLHKVTKNFKKVQFAFYEENNGGNTKALDLDLDKDINEFINIAKK